MITNPYPGLRPFRPEEAHLFFGREGQADAILERLAAKHFVAMVGVSGCGKSSLFNAGVFPGLHGGLLATPAREWRIARLQPREDPLRGLARELVGARGAVGSVALVEGILRHGSDGLANLVRGRLANELAGGSGAAPFAVLVVVDQFEEVFRFARLTSAEDAAHFVQLLIRAVSAGCGGLPLYVALAMRSDFQGDCAIFPGLPELINEAQYLVPRMTLREREDAIMRPAQTRGIKIARPLVDRLLDDMGDNPDQLPVLQHALQRTWEAWRLRTSGQGEVALKDYLSAGVGGMKNAIECQAEEAFVELASPRGQRLAEVLFRCLTEQADDRRGVRRPLEFRQIAAIAVASEKARGGPLEGSLRTEADLVTVIETFRQTAPPQENAPPGHLWQPRTFLTPDQSVPLGPETLLDISHESLIRNWPRLAGWVGQEAEAAKELRRLDDRSVHGGDLLGELALARAKRWLEGRSPDAAVAEESPAVRVQPAPGALVPSAAWARLYLDQDGTNSPGSRAGEESSAPDRPREASAARPGFQAVKRYVEQSDEALRLDRERRLQDREEKRRLERGRRKLWQRIFLYGTIAASGAACWLLILYLKAAEQRSLASSAALRARSLSDAMVQAAYNLIPSVRRAAADFGQQAKRLEAVVENAAKPNASPPSPLDIDRLRQSREAVRQVVEALDTLVQGKGISGKPESPDLFQEVTADINNAIADIENDLWSLSRARVMELVELAGKARLDHANRALGKRPERQSDLSAVAADLAAVEVILSFAKAFDLVVERDFPALLASLDGVRRELIEFQVRLPSFRVPNLAEWTPATARPVELAHPPKVNRVRFVDTNGLSVVVTAGEDRAVRFWKLDGRKFREEIILPSPLIDIDFKKDSRRSDDVMATATTGSPVRSFRWPRGNLAAPPSADRWFTRHADTVTDVEFGLYGQWVVSASADRTVRVFDPADREEIYYSATPPNSPLPGIVTAARFNPVNRDQIVSGCDDGGVRLHTVSRERSDRAIRELGNVGAPARRPEFSRDGELVLAASGAKLAQFWAIRRSDATGQRIEHDVPVTQATFRPKVEDKRYDFITCSTSGKVRWVRLRDNDSRSAPTVDHDEVLEPKHPDAVLSACWDDAGSRLATVGGGEAVVWEWEDGRPRARFRLKGLEPGTARAEFSPDGKRVVTYGSVSTLIWDLEQLRAP